MKREPSLLDKTSSRMDEISRNISATRVRNNTETHSFSKHKKNVKESCFIFLVKRRLATEQSQYERGCSSVKTGNGPISI